MVFTIRQSISDNHSVYKHLFLMGLFLLAFSYSANAGIFSFLSKAGKLGKAPDIDLSSTKLELPENFKELTAVTISPDAEGNWLIKQPDGTFVRFDSRGKNSADTAKKVLILRADNLPDSMDQFDSLPTDTPVFISGNKGHLFELKRAPSPALVYKRIRLPVIDMDKVKNALWLLQRPTTAAGIRFVQMSERADTGLPEKIYGSRLNVESVGRDHLVASMGLMKRQTVVLSGRIEGGQLFGPGKDGAGLLLSELRQSAVDNDIKLLILESDRPVAVLKKSVRSMDQALNNNSALYDNIGDLYSRLSDSGNKQLLDLHVSSSGEHQIAIHWQPPKVEMSRSSGVAVLAHLPVHSLLHSIRFYTPDEARGRELDSRMIPGIHSWVQYYLISSIVLGFIAIGTSYRLWNKIWGLRSRKAYRFLVVFLLFWLIHKLLFVALYIPLLGVFSFLWLIVSITYKVLNFFVLRPMRWFYSVIAA